MNRKGLHSLLVIAMLFVLFSAAKTSALTYQTGVGVSFTFNPRLAITLSSADLIISNLAPGNAADSNTITVTVNTNTAYGYTLNATVGEATNYNTRNLIRSDINDNFSSIAYGSSLASLTTDNTWGYAYKPSGQSSTWTTYSGLPLYSDTNNVATLISTQDPADSDSVEFKIAAKASATQPAGEYRNVISFVAVSNPIPEDPTPPTSCATPVPGLTYMQDLTSSNKATILSNMTEDSQYYLADKRDDKTYCVAKLKDGNLWMTQNLDHDIVTDGSVTYDNTTTDLGWNGTGYSTASWAPASATKATSDTTWTTGSAGDTIPESYDPGELYWNGIAGQYSSESDCTTAGGTWDSTNNLCNQISSTGNSHYHLGNYYNWTAAIASNDSSIYGVYDSGTGSYTNTETNQSICPAGWTLPIGGYYESPTVAPDKSFQHLVEQYGWNDSDWALGNNQKIWNSPINLGLSGYWYGMLENVGYSVDPWSSTASGDAYAYSLRASSGGYVIPVYYYDRYYGYSVRCITR